MIKVIFFSPTGSTKLMAMAVAAGLAEQLGEAEVDLIDVTLPQKRESDIELDAEDIAIVATATYAGRVPNKIMPFFRDHVKGNGARCIVAVTYGNRSYDDAQRELYQLMTANDLTVVGACAFVSYHAMSRTLAADRPNREDLAKADSYGKLIGGKLQAIPLPAQSIEIKGEVEPYYTPLKEDGSKAVFLKATPKVDRLYCKGGAGCEGRMDCVEVCPMGSISRKAPEVMTGICIKCHACLRICPSGARFFEDKDLASHIRMLEEHYGGQICENEVIL